jgi:hypothetical protein
MTDPLEEERKAIDLIARSPEGHLLHRHLRRVLESCIDFADESTLRQGHGRRTLARDLMSLMAQGIADTARTDGRRTDPAEPILATAGNARSVARTSARRRVTLESDDGWGFDPGTDPSPAAGSEPPAGSGGSGRPS